MGELLKRGPPAGPFLYIKEVYMEHLQYGTKQFSIKQYGRYLSDETPEGRIEQLLLGKSRMKAVSKNKESSEWVTQISPLYINSKANKFKVKSDTGEEVVSQTVLINGEHRKIRIRHKDETIISNQL